MTRAQRQSVYASMACNEALRLTDESTLGREWRIQNGMLLPAHSTGFWSAPTMSAKEDLADALSEFIGELTTLAEA